MATDSQQSLFPGADSPRPTGRQASTPSGAAASKNYFHPGSGAPLAARMRPRNLDEVVGQQHLLGPGKPLRRLIDGHGEMSIILYGPPGTGKTTLASLVSAVHGDDFVTLSALSSGVKDIRAVVDTARRNLIHGTRTVLFIDEVHRFSKTQQDALLAAVENRTVTLIAATTENPSFSVVAPLLSRSVLAQLTSLEPADIRQVVQRAIADPRGLDNAITVTDEAIEQLVMLAGGDARRALTYLEAAAETINTPAPADPEAPKPVLGAAELAASIDKAVVRYDRDGDQHYDVTSAFIKSIRGSDVDAALHYLARMIEAGEDPRFIARRLVIHASEDIGMADPTALHTAVAAAQAVQLIGLPEARLTLAQATIHLATAPKSNAVIAAIDAAMADVRRGKIGHVPPHLRDGHYAGAKALGNAVGYRYPHDDPKGVVPQQYLPTELAGVRYYTPTSRGGERAIKELLEKIQPIIHGPGAGPLR